MNCELIRLFVETFFLKILLIFDNQFQKITPLNNAAKSKT
jgi:hypothetical protein